MTGGTDGVDGDPEETTPVGLAKDETPLLRHMIRTGGGNPDAYISSRQLQLSPLLYARLMHTMAKVSAEELAEEAEGVTTVEEAFETTEGIVQAYDGMMQKLGKKLAEAGHTTELVEETYHSNWDTDEPADAAFKYLDL
jgi:hypothetical protein